MKSVFCTYGDHKFVKSRSRLILEARRTNLFDECLVFTEDVKKDTAFSSQMLNPLFAEVSNSGRGGGYWIWKPFILRKVLKSLSPGDIFVYADAGSTIPCSAGDSLKNSIEKVAVSEKGVLGCRNPYVEKEWTKGDVFCFFDAYDQLEITHSRQFSAGRMHIAKHCPHSLLIYNEWWRVACLRPDLFSDSSSHTQNLRGFRENRHDASVWSLICKTYGVEEEWDWESIPILPTRICF